MSSTKTRTEAKTETKPKSKTKTETSVKERASPKRVAASEDTHMRSIKGHYHELNDWKMDPKGYFLIRINNDQLELGHCKQGNIILTKITGRKPQDIYFTVVKENITKDPVHLAYLGKELQKADTARRLGIDYVQDAPLNFRNIKKTKKED